MKLTSELVAAVRATVAARKAEHISAHGNRYLYERDSIKQLLRVKPRVRHDLAKATRLLRQAKKFSLRAHDLMRRHGLDQEGSYISDREKFAKAGGVLREVPPMPRNINATLALLACGTPQACRRILRELGIQWG